MTTYSDTSISLAWSGPYDFFTLEMSDNGIANFTTVYPIGRQAVWMLVE